MRRFWTQSIVSAHWAAYVAFYAIGLGGMTSAQQTTGCKPTGNSTTVSTPQLPADVTSSESTTTETCPDGSVVTRTTQTTTSVLTVSFKRTTERALSDGTPCAPLIETWDETYTQSLSSATSGEYCDSAACCQLVGETLASYTHRIADLVVVTTKSVRCPDGYSWPQTTTTTAEQWQQDWTQFLDYEPVGDCGPTQTCSDVNHTWSDVWDGSQTVVVVDPCE